MKQRMKFIIISLFLISGSLSTQKAYACMGIADSDDWDINDWSDYVSSGDAANQGIDGTVWTDPADFYANASDAAIDAFWNSNYIYDRELPTLGVTAPQIINSNLTNLSTFGQEPVLPPFLDADYNPTYQEPRDCDGMQCPFCGGIIIPVDAPMRSPGMMRTGSACPTCKCAVKTKLFIDKCAGYNYIWQMSHDANGNFIREVAGLILEGGSVLIIPFENNLQEKTFTDVFTYVKTSTGIGVVLNGKVYEILQIVHTHPGEINIYKTNPLGYSTNADGVWAEKLGHDIQIMMDGGLYLVGNSNYASYFNLNQIKSPCEQ